MTPVYERGDDGSWHSQDDLARIAALESELVRMVDLVQALSKTSGVTRIGQLEAEITVLQDNLTRVNRQYTDLAERDNSAMDAALRERTEACAKLCETNNLIGGSIGPLMDHGWALCQRCCANAIRALLSLPRKYCFHGHHEALADTFRPLPGLKIQRLVCDVCYAKIMEARERVKVGGIPVDDLPF